MTPDALYDRLERGEPIRLLDVRNREEYEEWRIGGDGAISTLVPYSKFMSADVRDAVADVASDAGLDPEERVVVVCGRGEASDYVAELLREAGFEAENLDGGMRGWARVHASVVVPTDEAEIVFQYLRPSSGCLSYLVVSDGEGAVIDPLRQFTDRYLADLSEYDADLAYAVDTHVHADHVSGVRELAATTDATPVYPDGARDRGLRNDAASFVADGDVIRVGDAVLTAAHAPGHTTEMTAYRLGDLFVAGDSVFLESVARPDLAVDADGVPDAARRLYETMQSVYAGLDDDVRVAPGHYGDAAERASDGTYTARIDDLRRRLPAFSMSEAEFVAYVRDDIPPRPPNYEEILDANLGRSDVDDDAFEMELGPNNCAVPRAD